MDIAMDAPSKGMYCPASHSVSRGEQRCEQCGNGRHGHRHGHVTARQERHHVGRRAARGATDQDHARRNFGRQLQEPGHEECEQRHHDVLGCDAHRDGHGALGDQSEIDGTQCEAHAEHDQTQQCVGPAGGLLNRRGKEVSRSATGKNQDGEDQNRHVGGPVCGSGRGTGLLRG